MGKDGQSRGAKSRRQITRLLFHADSADFLQDFELKGDPETYAIIGAAMEVHRVLGYGFLEAAYQAALAIEFIERDIPSKAEVTLPIQYKGKTLACGYRADFLCFGKIVVETKAIAHPTRIDQAQLLNELKASRHDKGLLLNFGGPSLEHQRLVMSETNSRQPDPFSL